VQLEHRVGVDPPGPALVADAEALQVDDPVLVDGGDRDPGHARAGHPVPHDAVEPAEPPG
jgi:hypothetical protein